MSRYPLIALVAFGFAVAGGSSTLSSPSPYQGKGAQNPAHRPVVQHAAGYGALVDDWNATHADDPNDTYYQVSALDGRVTNYTITLHLGTSLQRTLATVKSQLPGDARREWFSRQNGCVEARYGSRTLARLLGSVDPGGGVSIEAEDDPPSATDPAPSPQTFTDVSLGLGTADAGEMSPGPC